MGRGEEREKDSTEMQERKRRRRIADVIYPSKGRWQKKQRENVGILKKKGGGSSRIPLPFFTVFNMGDLPKINGKIGKKFPNRGEGVPDLGKIPKFSRFFFGRHP